MIKISVDDLNALVLQFAKPMRKRSTSFMKLTESGRW